MRVGQIMMFSLFLIIVLAGCTKETVQTEAEKENYGPADPLYDMELVYDDDAKEIDGVMNVEFENNLDQTLEEIYFNLWPNAEEYEGGGIEIQSVQYNGESAPFDVDETELDVSGITLESGEKAEIDLEYTVTIPNAKDRFGWYDSYVVLGNWFPILAVHDQDDWVLSPYFDNGESFFSLTSEFDVQLETDHDYTIAATGQIEEVDTENDTNTYHLEAKDVRDFALVMHREFNKDTLEVDGIEVNVFYTDEYESYVDDIMRAAEDTLVVISELFGDYAWSELSIATVEFEDMAGIGMEYPQLGMVGMDYDYQNIDELDMVVIHEIAHQWFYSAIGNDQYNEPWLDEAFATFASYLVLENENPYLGWVNRLPVKDDYELTAPVSAFNENGSDEELSDYSNFIYYHGAKVLNDLRHEVGDDLFYEAMQTYYEEMKFKVATTEDFVQIMEDVTEEDLSDFFEENEIHVTETE